MGGGGGGAGVGGGGGAGGGVEHSHMKRHVAVDFLCVRRVFAYGTEAT